MKKVAFAAAALLVAMCQFGCSWGDWGGWWNVVQVGLDVINTADSFNLFPLGLP